MESSSSEPQRELWSHTVPTLVERHRRGPRPPNPTQGSGTLTVSVLFCCASAKDYVWTEESWNRHLLFWHQHPFPFLDNRILVLLWENARVSSSVPPGEAARLCSKEARTSSLTPPLTTRAGGRMSVCDPIRGNEASADTFGTKMAHFPTAFGVRSLGWRPLPCTRGQIFRKQPATSEAVESKNETSAGTSPAVKTLSFHCRGYRFDPWSGN